MDRHNPSTRCYFMCVFADISESLAKLLAERGQTPADTGISGVRHAASAASFTASSGSDMGTVLDTLVDRVKELRQRTAEATIFLPPYDVRRALEVINRSTSNLFPIPRLTLLYIHDLYHVLIWCGGVSRVPTSIFKFDGFGRLLAWSWYALSRLLNGSKSLLISP